MSGRKRPRTGIQHNLTILIEKAKNESSIHLQTKYLTTIANLCEEIDINIKTFLRESDGITVILEILFTSEVNSIRALCLKALGFLSIDCVENQNQLGFPNLFLFLRNILNETRNQMLLKNALFFLSCIVYQNKAGQTLVRVSKCLNSLLQLLVSYKPIVSDATTSQTSLDIWRLVMAVLQVCVNTPQNENNQDVCATILKDLVELIQTQTKAYVLLPTITLLISIIENNERNKLKFAKAKGIEAIFKIVEKHFSVLDEVSCIQTVEYLFMLLDICVFEDDENIMKLSLFNAVPLLITYLRKTTDLSTELQIVILLGHIIENNTFNKRQFLKCNSLHFLKIVMTTQNTNFIIAVTYLLTISSKETTLRAIPENDWSRGVSETNRIHSNDQKTTEDTKVLQSLTSKYPVFSTTSTHTSASMQDQKSLSQNFTSKTRHLVSSSLHSYPPRKTSAESDSASELEHSRFLISNIPFRSRFQLSHLPTSSLEYSFGYDDDVSIQESVTCMCDYFQKEDPFLRCNCCRRIAELKDFYLNTKHQLNCCCEACTPTDKIFSLHNADIKNPIRSNKTQNHSQSSVLENQSYEASTEYKKSLTSFTEINNSGLKIPQIPKDRSRNKYVLMNLGKSNLTNTSSSDGSISNDNKSENLRSSESSNFNSMDSEDSKLGTHSYSNKDNDTVPMDMEAATVESLLQCQRERFGCYLKPVSDRDIKQKNSLADLWKTDSKILTSVASNLTSKNQKQTSVIEAQKFENDDTSEFETANLSQYIDVCDTVANSDDGSSLGSPYRHPEKRNKIDGERTEASESGVYYLDRKRDFSKSC